MLHVEHLSKTFEGSAGPVTALSEATFDAADGEIVAIVGPSGSGKSTLLSLLGLLDRPDTGRIEVNGIDVSGSTESDRARFRCATVGFVFQNFQLISNLSAIENVCLPMEYAGMDRHARQERASSLLDQVGSSDAKQQRRPARLSGGEQQRVAIARALGNAPAVLLADEPTGNLDRVTGETIIGLLSSLAGTSGSTLLLVTHDDAVARAASRVLRIVDGVLSEDDAILVQGS